MSYIACYIAIACFLHAILPIITDAKPYFTLESWMIGYQQCTMNSEDGSEYYIRQLSFLPYAVLTWCSSDPNDNQPWSCDLEI